MTQSQSGTEYPKPPFKQGKQEFPGDQAQMMPQPDFGLQSYQGCGRLTGQVAIIFKWMKVRVVNV